MNYGEAIEYIHSVSWRGSRLGLSRTKELLGRMGNPEKALKFVHIAGTNGKGSTAAMLSSVLTEAGYKTGLYTSPYIGRFNERMRVNGLDIPDGELAAITGYVAPFAEAMDDKPTEFELITAVAFEYFKRSRCDIVVAEVGMGGELDSTNVIERPEVAVITAMGYDHTRELGATMAEIARAKAGIIKPGTDVVVYGQNSEALKVFELACAERGARLHKTDFSRLVPRACSLDVQTFDFGCYAGLRLHLIGSYQLSNAAVALTAVDVLKSKGWDISDAAVAHGMEGARWPARFEIVLKAPVFIVDGAHNPQGIRATAQSLKDRFPGRKFVFLMGVMADKDVDDMLGVIAPLSEGLITVTPDNPRAMSAAELARKAGGAGMSARACRSVGEGVKEAIAAAGKEGLVCAIGSLYMSGPVREALGAVSKTYD